jgi:hypothetical protein
MAILIDGYGSETYIDNPKSKHMLVVRSPVLIQRYGAFWTGKDWVNDRRRCKLYTRSEIYQIDLEHLKQRLADALDVPLGTFGFSIIVETLNNEEDPRVVDSYQVPKPTMSTETHWVKVNGIEEVPEGDWLFYTAESQDILRIHTGSKRKELAIIGGKFCFDRARVLAYASLPTSPKGIYE